MSDTPILALDKIRFAYAGNARLFDNLSFALSQGEQVGLYGPNGCGKTTLLRLIMGLERPQGGGVLFQGAPLGDGKSWQRLRRAVGLLLQNSDDQLFSPTVLEDVAFGPLNLGLKKKEARLRALETLAGLGLENLAERPTQRLSAGQKKMVALASVMAMRPQALLLDEPTAFLDDAFREKIIGVLKRQTIARLVVSHDRDFLRQTTTTLLGIRDGRLDRACFAAPE